MIYSFVPNENTKYNICCYDKSNRDVEYQPKKEKK